MGEGLWVNAKRFSPLTFNLLIINLIINDSRH